MDEKKLYFINYLIYECARSWGRRPGEVYRLFTQSHALDYLHDGYDVLHTQGVQYLRQDLVDYMSNRGVYVWLFIAVPPRLLNSHSPSTPIAFISQRAIDALLKFEKSYEVSYDP